MDKSKEAKSTNWIYATLTDFNGKLEARDVIRLLKFVAQKATIDSIWTGGWRQCLNLGEILQ